MRILIDSGDIDAVRAAFVSGFVAGATTNPTLLRRAGVRASAVPTLARAILQAGAGELHLQAYADDADGMVREGEALAAIDPARILIKLVATPAGYQAAARLSALGVRVTLTAVYTLRQALLAESVGASYIAIYLGRMRDAGIDAMGIAEQMQQLLVFQSARVAILAASIRSPDEVVELAARGVAAATLPPALLNQLLDSPATAGAAATFSADARALIDAG